MYENDKFIYIDEVNESGLIEIRLGGIFNSEQDLKSYANECLKKMLRRTMCKLEEDNDYYCLDAEYDLNTRARYYIQSDEFILVKGIVNTTEYTYETSIFNFDY